MWMILLMGIILSSVHLQHGQVGVVWSRPVSLNNGDNIINLDLKDAA